LSGRDIPSQFEGDIEILEERTSRKGIAMLLIAVLNNEADYGPIFLFNPDIINLTKKNGWDRFACQVVHNTAHRNPSSNSLSSKL
jgi:hypothetical protein